jgi:nicotinamidase-related amidase
VPKRDEFLRSIVDPASTAVLTMELQEGVVGSGGQLLPALAAEVDRTGVLDVARRVCGAARDVGARVVHCTFESRADGAGVVANCKILARNERLRREGFAATQVGTAGVELVAGLGDPRDVIVPRLHGMTPFTSTSLDQVLRNLGVRTVIATGVSVNIGIFGMVVNAVDLGYQAVVVRDAVLGIPAEYSQAVIDNSLSMLATIVTADELLATWETLNPAT